MVQWKKHIKDSTRRSITGFFTSLLVFYPFFGFDTFNFMVSAVLTVVIIIVYATQDGLIELWHERNGKDVK